MLKNAAPHNHGNNGKRVTFQSLGLDRCQSIQPNNQLFQKARSLDSLINRDTKFLNQCFSTGVQRHTSMP